MNRIRNKHEFDILFITLLRAATFYTYHVSYAFWNSWRQAIAPLWPKSDNCHYAILHMLDMTHVIQKSVHSITECLCNRACWRKVCLRCSDWNMHVYPATVKNLTDSLVKKHDHVEPLICPHYSADPVQTSEFIENLLFMLEHWFVHISWTYITASTQSFIYLKLFGFYVATIIAVSVFQSYINEIQMMQISNHSL